MDDDESMIDEYLDPIELVEDQHGPLDAFRSPPSRRLERGEDLVETGTEVFEDVVPVQTHAVPSMQSARSAYLRG